MLRWLKDPRHDAWKVALTSLLTFGLQALAWPLGPGRDAYSYFYYFYNWGNPNPEQWFTMLFRTPLAPVFNVFLIDGLGPVLAEVLMAAIFAGVHVLLFQAARSWNRRLAWVFVVALLAHFAYGSLYHVVSNDPPVAALFAGTLAVAVWGAWNPKPARFALLGAATGLLLLARPGIFAAVGVAVFLLPGLSWRAKGVRAALFVAGLAPFVLGWSFHNYRTHGVFAFSIGTEAFLPMGRLLAVEKTVRVANGPASRELGRLIERELIPRRTDLRGYDADRYLLERGHYADLMDAVHRASGRHDYHLISRAGWEAVAAQPLQYFKGVAFTFAHMMAGNLKLPVPLTNGTFVHTHKGVVGYQRDGRDQFSPLSEVDPHSLRPDARSEENMARQGPNLLRAYRTASRLPTRDGWIGLGRVLNWLATVYPPMLFVVLGTIVLAIRRWKDWIGSGAVRALFWLWALALLTEAAASAGIWVATYQYRLPFDVVYVLLPLVLVFGLQGERLARPKRNQKRRSLAH